MLRCKKKKRKKELKEECVHQEALPCPAAGTQPPVSLWPSGGPCLLSESDECLIAQGLLSKRNNRDDASDLKIVAPSVREVSGRGEVRRPCQGTTLGSRPTFIPGKLCDRGPVSQPLSVFSSIKWE